MGGKSTRRSWSASEIEKTLKKIEEKEKPQKSLRRILCEGAGNRG